MKKLKIKIIFKFDSLSYSLTNYFSLEKKERKIRINLTLKIAKQ
jgi:hypothetical protein